PGLASEARYATPLEAPHNAESLLTSKLAEALPTRSGDQTARAKNRCAYPHREWGDMFDGNDHVISHHACVMMCGEDRAARNVYIN
ncbi:hypothetical protein, partial [Frankia sp. CgMI4]|uniref:hypothetical protein n=1 Tax=Frankia sp. CgMI4 TaxID=1742262 RepID=UPI001C2F9585